MRVFGLDALVEYALVAIVFVVPYQPSCVPGEIV